VVQTVDEEETYNLPGILKARKVSGLAGVLNYAFTLQCQLVASGVRAVANIDKNVLDEVSARRILYQFEHVINQLNDPATSDQKLRDIELLTGNDRSDIEKWNGSGM
jgi:hypothetical protein